MSKPVIPDVNQEKALTNLLESIALEETALAHILNAEGEKIQKINEKICNLEPADIIKLQESVRKTLRLPIKKEILLQFKLEDVLEYKSKLHNKQGC